MAEGSFEDVEELGPVKSASVAVEAARALRNEILRRAPDDMFLGSEDDLVDRLGVSKPTFRQAARLLEYEELLTVRRGVGGGYFGRRPSAEVVARMAGIYLLAQGTTFEEVIRTQSPLEATALREVAAQPDAALRARPLEFLEGSAQLRPPFEVREAVRGINAFWRMVAELVGNRALVLFIQTAQSYGAKSAGLAFSANRLEHYVASLRRTAEALRDGDADRAIQASSERSAMMIGWMKEDATR